MTELKELVTDCLWIDKFVFTMIGDSINEVNDVHPDYHHGDTHWLAIRHGGQHHRLDKLLILPDGWLQETVKALGISA